MARRDRRLSTNAAGDFFVDDSCIDCATCRWVAPETFDASGDASRVFQQPAGPAQTRRALMAVVACPTASIGTTAKHDIKAARDAFPERWVSTGGGPAHGVYHSGFHAESSFGAASYLIVRDGGNVLVDSPRFSRPLARQLAALGGVQTMFLTHRDDVADHVRWAEHFGCERVMHRADLSAATAMIERRVEGEDPIALAEDLLIIPTPGHTRGSACLLHREVLLTGDHLAFSAELGHLYGFQRACWYRWDQVVASTARLFAEHRFSAVLPGHGRPLLLESPEAMEPQKAACLAWMGMA